MKKLTFVFIVAVSVAILIVSIIGVANNKIGLIATIPVCICVIFLANALYDARKNIDWYIKYTKDIKAHNDELKKAISAKDEAISSYKWEIDSLKKKLMR